MRAATVLSCCPAGCDAVFDIDKVTPREIDEAAAYTSGSTTGERASEITSLAQL